MRQFQHLGVSPATRKLFRVAVKQFLAFCETQPLPASSLTLCLFCTHLSTRAQHKSIKVYLSYISGISLWHIENEVENKCGDPLLQLLCSGIRREQGVSTSDTRRSITVDILARLFEGIDMCVCVLDIHNRVPLHTQSYMTRIFMNELNNKNQSDHHCGEVRTKRW